MAVHRKKKKQIIKIHYGAGQRCLRSVLDIIHSRHGKPHLEVQDSPRAGYRIIKQLHGKAYEIPEGKFLQQQYQ